MPNEVRQIVTFSFLPGKAAEALTVFREQAVPLYRADRAMLNFRGFREVESPVPMDLMVVSGFEGMAGMDRSNAELRALAAEAGTGIGAIYGSIASLSTGHTDEFVEMLPDLGTGDPSSLRLTVFVWYRLSPGEAETFERTLESTIVPRERSLGTASATGRFLVSDGWHYLRLLAFDSLGAYQVYRDRIERTPGYRTLAGVVAERREVIVASVSELSVR